MIGAIILQVVLIFLNAVFAAAEIAVVSTNGAKLEKMAEDGNKKAKKLFSLTKNTSKFLSTIQVAITLAGLLGGHAEVCLHLFCTVRLDLDQVHEWSAPSFSHQSRRAG